MTTCHLNIYTIYCKGSS